MNSIDCLITNSASSKRPITFVLTLRKVFKRKGKKVTVLRTMTTNIVTVSFLSDDTAPDEYGGAFLFTFKAIIT